MTFLFTVLYNFCLHTDQQLEDLGKAATPAKRRAVKVDFSAGAPLRKIYFSTFLRICDQLSVKKISNRTNK